MTILITSNPILGKMQNHLEEYGLLSPIVQDLLQKRRKIGTILELNGISNEKNIVFLTHDQRSLFRIYEIKNAGMVWFEISEEINLDYLYYIQREFSLPN